MAIDSYRSDKTGVKRKHLLVVAHCPSPNTLSLLDQLQIGIEEQRSEDSEYSIRSPFETSPEHVLQADALILGTTENLGYMSGALKDFFDRIYYPTLELKRGMPCAAFIRAGHDGTGTKHALETITTGLRWRWVQEPVILKGDFQAEFLNETKDLGAAMMSALDQGII